MSWQLWCRSWEERYGWTRWHDLERRFKYEGHAVKDIEEARANAESLKPGTVLEYELREKGAT